jgi:hypothetical protein
MPENMVENLKLWRTNAEDALAEAKKSLTPMRAAHCSMSPPATKDWFNKLSCS